MLGYKSYSHFILEVRMAKEPMSVQNFEESLTKKILDKGRSEFGIACFQQRWLQP